MARRSCQRLYPHVTHCQALHGAPPRHADGPTSGHSFEAPVGASPAAAYHVSHCPLQAAADLASSPSARGSACTRLTLRARVRVRVHVRVRACARACACACACACARTLAPSVSSISPGRAGAGAKSLRGSPAEGPPLSAEATRRRPLAEQLAFEAPRAGEPCSTAVRIVPFGAFLELLRRLAAAGTSSNLCSDAVALLFKSLTHENSTNLF